MELTEDTLKAERAALVQQQVQAQAQLNAITGALTMVDHLIAKLQTPVPVVESLANTEAEKVGS